MEWCERIEQPIVLIGGKEDETRAMELSSMLPNKSIFHAVGKFNLLQSASIIQQAEKVFTHDTGMMHIAAAFDKKIISFWGNTTPALGMYPYLVKDSTIIEAINLSCRPCSKIGFDKCPKGHFNCMNLPSVNDYIKE